MKAVMTADIPAFRNAEAAGFGSRGTKAPESSFMDTLKKAATEKHEPKPRQEKKAEQVQDAAQPKDISDKSPEPKAGEALEENDQEEGAGKPQKDKDPVVDPSLVVMMAPTGIFQAEPEDTAGQTDGLYVEEAAADPLQGLQGTVVRDADRLNTPDMLHSLPDQEHSTAGNGAEAFYASDGTKESRPALQMTAEKEGLGRTGSITSAAQETGTEKVIAEPAVNGGETDFSDLLKDRSELLRSMAQAGKGPENGSGPEKQDTAEPGLEELKRNAGANGADMMSRLAMSNLSGRFHVQAKGGEPAQSIPVLDQLQAGLKQAVESRQELTVHLKPEGLGDIVIRLASSEGRVTVNIGVSNSDTQKLITGQMASLKEMLEPLHAEVGEVYHDSQAAMNFLEYGQQMQGHENRQQAGRGGRQGRAAAREEDTILAVAEQMMAESAAGRLYTYI